jgi:alginate O-acetyltransferase complex protein AlgI
MLFNSFNFILIFFPFVLFVSSRLKGLSLIRWITLSSIVFYSYAGQKWFVIPMLFTTTLDFYLAKIMEVSPVGHNRRKVIMIFSLCGNLGLLFLFKYSGLFSDAFQFLFHSNFKNLVALGLPAGISFYTFQTMSYMIDVYRGDCVAEKSFWKFAAFVSFFPHLVAGPLTRHNQLIPQLDRIEIEGIKPRWHMGIYLFAVGLSKKVLIADRIGNLVDPMLLDIGRLDFFSSWLALVGYAMQIYFDFSGYSDMAIGLGRLFNIELPQNFNSPYKSLNPSDFWRRWHITLSRWLKDYLYISLGGNRCSPFRKNLNLMITMALGGFWHGANWTFIGWGVFHGTILIVYHQIQTTWDALNVYVQRIITFLLVCFGWVFFRAPSFYDAYIWFRKLLFLDGMGHFSFNADGISLLAFNILGLIIVNKFANASSKDWQVVSNSRQFALGLVTLCALIFMNYSSKFLYYQF